MGPRRAVLVTGMSGTGKSTVLGELARRGHRVVDTDRGGWIVDGSEPLWDEDRIDRLLAGHDRGALFVAGCVANQGTFAPRFDVVVLLTAPLDVVLHRIATRSTNDFGKSPDERQRIVQDIAEIEPLLRAGATAEIDTRRPLHDVADVLESMVEVHGG